MTQVLAAVKQTGWALLYADDRLRKDKDFVKRAVQLSGCSLQYADAKLQACREVVQLAIRQDGLALAYASEALKGDRYLVAEANETQQQYQAKLAAQQRRESRSDSRTPAYLS